MEKNENYCDYCQQNFNKGDVVIVSSTSNWSKMHEDCFSDYCHDSIEEEIIWT